MKKYLLFLYFYFCIISILFAQKPCIDSSSYHRWENVERPSISNNGQFVAYNIKTENNHDLSLNFIIQSTQKDWRMEVLGGCIGRSQFSTDSKKCLFITKGDSLSIVNLDNKSIKFIPNVASFDVSKDNSKEIVVYLSNQPEKMLTVCNLKTGKEFFFKNVSFYEMSEDGNSLVIQTQLQNDLYQSTCWINLTTGESQIISKAKVENIIIDFNHGQMAFNVNKCIWYYKNGMSKSICLIDSVSLRSTRGLRLSYFGPFSKDGERLFFTFKQVMNESEFRPAKETVEIWSYKDYKLQSLQNNEIYKTESCKAIINIADRSFIQLSQYKGEFDSYGPSDNYLLSSYTYADVDPGETWIDDAKAAFDLIDVAHGRRKKLDSFTYSANLRDRYSVKFSPCGRFLLYYDSNLQDYFCYDIVLDKLSNLTNNIHSSWLNESNDSGKVPRGVAGWLPNDEAVLLYSSHDIWKLSLSKKEEPINLTNDYGIKHNTIFSLALYDGSDCILKTTERLILSAFNTKSKDNGFFCMRVNKSGDPELLTMGPYIYKTNTSNALEWLGFTPLKAKNANVYVVQRMDASDAPNYFSTSDFKTFKRLSNLQPAKKYNWYTTELLSWKSIDGRILQGILFKPENFDSNKKYPIIFHCYQRLSDGLNGYLRPRFSSGALDIPSYVSNGYLVFCPDIQYTLTDPMQGTYDAVISAASYVSKLTFVDSKKMGIQGHSFGAIQTNYLITHSNIFAAACSSSGQADWISGYGTLKGEGGSLQSMYEIGQNRMASTLWGNLEGYIKNSSILQADKVITPLLIKHGKLDPICPYSNEMEFFLGLRRLGKKVWMLVYPQGPHSLDGKDAEDFTVRMQQFFDHYLKDTPAPIWMLDGVTAKERGIKTGLELDASGRTPGPGLLTLQEQNKVDSLMTRKPITIVLK